MATYFLDSSALVKRYVNEIGTARLAEIMDPARQNRLHAASISVVEVVAAVTRRQRSGSMTPSAAREVCRRFRREFSSLFGIIELSPSLLTRATDLAEKHALRGYDAVQLAAALEVHGQGLSLGFPCTLLSADTELNLAGRQEGLPVDDPTALT